MQTLQEVRNELAAVYEKVKLLKHAPDCVPNDINHALEYIHKALSWLGYFPWEKEYKK